MKTMKSKRKPRNSRIKMLLALLSKKTNALKRKQSRRSKKAVNSSDLRNAATN